MKKEIENPFSDDNCFFCGSNNKFGLKLKFYWDEKEKKVYTRYLPAKHFTGQGDILHGAIQMGLLDEIMGWTSYMLTKKMAVTSCIDIKFLKPTYINLEKLSITCQLISKDGPKIKMINIIPFRDSHAVEFKRLNTEWLEAYGLYEAADSKCLDDPHTNILKKGGKILIATSKNNVIGTCAIKVATKQTAELEKLAVSP